MDTLVFLGRTLGFSVAAGVNLYATIALIGLASRFGWVALPPEYAIFDSDWVIGAAFLLYTVEFIADKVLLGRHPVGYGPHLHPASRRRRRRRGLAR